MSISYEKYLSKYYIHCRMSGVGELDEVLAYVNQIYNDEDLNQPFYEVVDFSEVENLNFGYYESNHLQSKYQHLSQQKGYLGTIFVAVNIFGQAMAKMYKTTAEPKGIIIQVVQSLAEAELLIASLISES